MHLTRRDFLKYCLGSAALLGLDATVLGRLREALAAGGPTVIWLNGSGCSGCTVSLANLVSTSGPTDVADLLINTIDLAFHPTLMSAAGDLAVESLATASAGSFLLVVEGGIPTGRLLRRRTMQHPRQLPPRG
jgi:hydrogenase small subunit